MLFGNGIAVGKCIEDVNNLDLAPTFLSILGLDIPIEMEGRVLREAFE